VYHISSMSLKVVHLSLIMLSLAVVLFVYFGRDKLVERMENDLAIEKGDRGLPGPRGKRGGRGPTGAAGGEFKMMGRLSDVSCLEGDSTGVGSCHATVNKLGGIALGKTSHDLGQIWQHQSDGTMKNLGRDRCLNIKKNEGVGADAVQLDRCGDTTRWHYDTRMRMMPVAQNDGWALGADKDGILAMVESKNAKQWTFFN